LASGHSGLSACEIVIPITGAEPRGVTVFGRTTPGAGSLSGVLAARTRVAAGREADPSLLVADSQTGLIRRFRPQTALDALHATDRLPAAGRRLVGVPVPFDGAADIVLAVDGD